MRPSSVSTPFESFWDLAYRDGSYRDHWHCDTPGDELVELVAERGFGAGTTVLDVGCGAGTEAIYMASLGCQVLGVDSSKPALEIARRRAAAAGVEVEWSSASAFAMSVPDGTVDLALDRGLFHGLDPEDRPRLAPELRRVLKPGGVLLLRGAREDREEEGLFAVDGAQIERSFPDSAFARGQLRDTVLESAAGDLPAHAVLLVRR